MKKIRLMKAHALFLSVCVTLSTFDMTAFATTTSTYAMGYNDVDDLIIPSIQDGSTFESQYGTETLPSAYSSVTAGYTTPVRDQNPWGDCWSFAAMGMAESNLMRKGLADSSLNLSELQLAYFFYHSVADPLGNTTGDSTEALTDNYLDQGGNSIFTTFALANWVGAAMESKAPYETATASGTLNSSLAFDDAYHMQNAYWINMTDGRDYIKTMIKNYGAVATSYYQSTSYYNSSTYAYYKNDGYNTNHAVIIVGWDDNFDKSKFNTQPSSNGAWLVKNSWGESFGDSGYFWISYEDNAFTSSTSSRAFVFDFESGNNYDHNYQYDGSYGYRAFGVYSGGSIANIFTAAGNDGGAEQIDAVSFALYDANVNYSVQIYTDITDPSNPTSGIAALATPKTGSTTFAGYYTVPLDESIAIDEGEKFSVVVTLSEMDGSPSYFLVDTTYQNSDWIKFTNATSIGQSFEKISTNSNWSDLNSDGATARIKAFTSDTTNTIISPKEISLNSSTLNMNLGQTTTLTATVLPSNATDKSVTWNTSDSNVATVDSTGIVTAKSVGTANITATTINGFTVTCKVIVENLPTSISLNSGSNTMKVGETITLTPVMIPSDAADKSVTWSTSNSNVATVDANGVVTAIGAGTANIIATTVNGITAIYQVIVEGILPISISLNSNLVSMNPGQTSTLTATISPTNATDKSVLWSSSNEAVASVDSNGLVTAIAAGTATITAKTSNNIQATCTITVINPTILATQINLNTNSLALKAGETATLLATVFPTNATDKTVSWSSTNGNVATVDGNGKVTVNGVGTATIVATTSNGLTAFCQVAGSVGKITGLKASSQTTKSIKLSWMKQNGVGGYEIYRLNPNTKKYVKIATNSKASKNTFTDKSKEVGTTYKYKVRAYTKINGKKVYGAYSSILQTSTKTATPTISLSALSKAIKINWGQIDGATGYEIYMSTKKSSGYELVKTITKGKTTSYTKKSLTRKKTYYFKIRTYKKVAGVKIYSSYSKVKSIKVK